MGKIIKGLADCKFEQGVDSAVHMAEEVKDASCLSIQNVELQIVASEAPYPFVDIFAIATGSTAGAIGMTIPVVQY